jgi:predicted  nucleic acid-binding Zn-ribbon protein
MKNRAKCKVCKSIIESFHSTDLVICNCGEIFVDGGDAMKCGATDFANFLRVDDHGNEIVVTVTEKNEPIESRIDDPIGFSIDEMIKNIESLPEHAKSSSVTQYDLMSVLLILRAMHK